MQEYYTNLVTYGYTSRERRNFNKKRDTQKAKAKFKNFLLDRL